MPQYYVSLDNISHKKNSSQVLNDFKQMELSKLSFHWIFRDRIKKEHKLLVPRNSTENFGWRKNFETINFIAIMV